MSVAVENDACSSDALGRFGQIFPVVHDVGEATHQFGVEVRLELNRAPGSVGNDEVGLDRSQRVQRFQQRDA